MSFSHTSHDTSGNVSHCKMTPPKKIISKLLGLELFVVLFLVLYAVFIDIDAMGITILIGLLFWVLHWFTDRCPITRTPADIGIFILILITAFSIWLSSSDEGTIYQVLRIWMGIVLFYAVVNWTVSKIRLIVLTFIFVLIGSALAMMALLGVDWAFNKLPLIPETLYQYLPPILGGVFHRNVWAGYLVIILPPILGDFSTR